ncbi:hypothetical protein F982_00342, partial [Acinetobacter baumannii NIPH 1362]
RSVQESEPKTHAWFYVLLAIAGLRNSPARHGSSDVSNQALCGTSRLAPHNDRLSQPVK